MPYCILQRSMQRAREEKPCIQSTQPRGRVHWRRGYLLSSQVINFGCSFCDHLKETPLSPLVTFGSYTSIDAWQVAASFCEDQKILEVVKSHRLKYTPNESSPGSSSPVPASPLEPEPFKNWEFVQNYIESLGEEKMNWNACFIECQNQSVLSSYTRPSSLELKSGYQRWKRQQK